MKLRQTPHRRWTAGRAFWLVAAFALGSGTGQAQPQAQVPPPSQAQAPDVPDAWTRVTQTDTLTVMLNDKAFETWGPQGMTWVKLISRKGSVQETLGVAYELAWYMANCESGRLKITRSTLYRADGQVYATRPDGEFRDPLLGSLGELIMQQICRDRDFRRPGF